jgi:hypothetical protein
MIRPKTDEVKMLDADCLLSYSSNMQDDTKVAPSRYYLHIPCPTPLIEAVDQYAAKLSAKTGRISVSRTAAARALLQIGLERALDERKR